jgi:hypothetical protein
MFVFGGILSACDMYYAEKISKEVVRQAGGWGAAVATAKYGAKVGAKLGAAAAGILGQAGPQVALPEELITVPAFVVLGSMAGGFAGGLLGWVSGSTVSEVSFDYLFQPLAKEEWNVSVTEDNDFIQQP